MVLIESKDGRNGSEAMAKVTHSIGVLLRVLLPATLILAPAVATAQDKDLPDKGRIVLMAQLAAGTGLDIVARTFAERLSARIGQPVLIENRPGSAGLATAEAVLKAEPDGATLGVVTS